MTCLHLRGQFELDHLLLKTVRLRRDCFRVHRQRHVLPRRTDRSHDGALRLGDRFLSLTLRRGGGGALELALLLGLPVAVLFDQC